MVEIILLGLSGKIGCYHLENASLEVDISVGASMEKSIKDIRELSISNGSISKVLYLKGTERNNIILGGLFNINNKISFDTSIKREAILVKDGVPIMEGYFQILNINWNERFEYIYEVVMFDTITNFFIDMNEKLITGNDDKSDDLDFSQWDHQFNINTLTQSWVEDSDNLPYIYKVFDTTNNVRINISDFIPCFWTKSIFDAIFRKWKIRYESDFLNSEYFYKLLHPFNGSNINEYRSEYDLSIGATGCSTYIGNRLTTTGGNEVYISTEMAGSLTVKEDVKNNIVPQLYGTNILPPATPSPTNLWQPDAPGNLWGFADEPMVSGGTKRIWFPFNQLIKGDPTLLYGEFLCEPTTGVGPTLTRNLVSHYLSPVKGSVEISFNINVRLDLKNENAFAAYAKNLTGFKYKSSSNLDPFPIASVKDNPELKVRVHLLRNPNLNLTYRNTWMTEGSITYTNHSGQFPNILANETKTEYFNLSGTFNIPSINSGDYFQIVVELMTSSSYYDAPGEDIPNTLFLAGNRLGRPPIGFTKPIKMRLVLGDFSNQPLMAPPRLDFKFSPLILQEGNISYLNSFLPKEVKQKDFIKSIFNTFNLYMMPIPGKRRTVLIEPRDTFYKKGDIIDMRDRCIK
jgi:hypothetical protein